jgi:hypothetical protein
MHCLCTETKLPIRYGLVWQSMREQRAAECGGDKVALHTPVLRTSHHADTTIEQGLADSAEVSTLPHREECSCVQESQCVCVCTCSVQQ